MWAQPQKVARILAAVQQELDRDCPVIVGPWTGEVGYELLYWIPFVRWAITACQVPLERVIVVSRGGTRSWYSGIGIGTYVDAFDLMTPAELMALGGAKPKQSAWRDEGGIELLTRVKHACHLTETAQLVPHWMYRLYRYYWDGDAPLDFVAGHAAWTSVAPPALPTLVGPLPPDFVAVRFYFSRSFPETESNQRFARDMIERLARSRPVVLLNHSLVLDDHSDLPMHSSLRSIADVMQPATNLAVQTAVIGQAAAFVGTYGGLSLLPPLCRVPSYAFCSVPFMKPYHEQGIARMISQSQGAPLRVGDTVDGTAQAQALLTDLGAR